MTPNIRKNAVEKTAWLSVHPPDKEDSAAVSAIRSVAAPMKGKLTGTAARTPFDIIIEQVMALDGVAFDEQLGRAGI